MPKICFVSNELAPYTWGGCGTLLRNLAQQLLSEENDVVFLLDVSATDFAAFDNNSFTRPERVKAYHVEALCGDLEQEAPGHAWQLTTAARRYHHALTRVAAIENLDVIEFSDYFGSALFALAAKIAHGAYARSRIAVRMHNPISSILALEPHNPVSTEKPLLSGMERYSITLAETVLINTPGYLPGGSAPRFPILSGQPVTSPPPLWPRPERVVKEPVPNDILFFGRLHGFKGVDVFLDAALAFLRRNPHTEARFLLAGHDSPQTPAGPGSYAAYLMARIPKALESRFEFPGSTGPADLASRLRGVRFAVFPSLLESFCYAAHEVHASGTPLIVNDIPAFRDAFIDGETALFFNGTSADLALCMETLWTGQALRERISNSPLPAFPPQNDRYGRPVALPTWIKPPGTAPRPAIPLVAILAGGSAGTGNTIRRLLDQGVAPSRIVVLEPGEDQATGFSFLGRLVRPLDINGHPVPQTGAVTAEALLILREGDLPLEDFLPTGLDVLARQPEISFVGAFARVFDETGEWLDCLPLDATLELRPFLDRPHLSRAIMRTVPGTPLSALFDPLLVQYGEISHLLSLVAQTGPGITIPAPMIKRRAEAGQPWPIEPLAYLLDKHLSGSASHIPRSMAQCAVWSRESLRCEAVAQAQRHSQCSGRVRLLETHLAQAGSEIEHASRRIAALEEEADMLRIALKEGRRRETDLGEARARDARVLETLRGEREHDARALETVRGERDLAGEKAAMLAERLAAVENSLTWKCGIRIALSPPGRLAKRLLGRLGW